MFLTMKNTRRISSCRSYDTTLRVYTTLPLRTFFLKKEASEKHIKSKQERKTENKQEKMKHKKQASKKERQNKQARKTENKQ